MRICSLIALACLALVGQLEASPVDECRSDMLFALADMSIPDDVKSLGEKVRASYPDKPLAQITKEEVKNKFQLPAGCRNHFQAMQDLFTSESCLKVNADEALTQQFWLSIPSKSALDNFLGTMKVCIFLTTA